MTKIINYLIVILLLLCCKNNNNSNKDNNKITNEDGGNINKTNKDKDSEKETINNNQPQNPENDKTDKSNKQNQNICEEMISNLEKETKLNKNLINGSFGLVIGAAIGDSIGSFVEFDPKPSNANIEKAMQMPGGGYWETNITSGQVTDDTELALSLAYGLNDFVKLKPQNQQFDINSIAKRYREWSNSGPFDKGITTRKTIGGELKVNINGNLAMLMKTAAKKWNEISQEENKSAGVVSNGSLMRCMPLIIFGYKLSDDDLYLILKEDSTLSHANYYVYFMNACYGIACKYLINTFGNNDINRNKNAFAKAEDWLKNRLSNESSKPIQNILNQILNWLNKTKSSNKKGLHSATKYIGYAKIAFQRSFYHLWNNSNFSDAIKETISEGGDTDTNACIVGGLIGALHGFNGIPLKYIDIIMKCKPNSDRDGYQAKLYYEDHLLSNIIKNAPSKINLKDYSQFDKIDEKDVKLNPDFS